jgi:hypothetical protein
MAVFLQDQSNSLFAEFSSVFESKTPFFGKMFLGENIFKIITSVPGANPPTFEFTTTTTLAL